MKRQKMEMVLESGSDCRSPLPILDLQKQQKTKLTNVNYATAVVLVGRSVCSEVKKKRNMLDNSGQDNGRSKCGNEGNESQSNENDAQ